MISHNWDGDIFFGRAWCDQHGDGVITAAKKEFKEHVEEMEKQRDITFEDIDLDDNFNPWAFSQHQSDSAVKGKKVNESLTSSFTNPFYNEKNPFLNTNYNWYNHTSEWCWTLLRWDVSVRLYFHYWYNVSFSLLSRWPTRHGTLVSHGSLYRQYTADNSFDFTKDKLTVLDRNSYSLYTVDMLCHKMAHRKLIEVPPAVSWSTKARDPLAFIFPVKVVIVRNFLPWVYVPFCKEHYLDEHRNNKLWEPCSLTYTPSGLRSKL